MAGARLTQPVCLHRVKGVDNSSNTANWRAQTARKFGGERQWDKRWVACPKGMGKGLKAGGERGMAASKAQAAAALQAGRQATQSRKAVLHQQRGTAAQRSTVYP